MANPADQYIEINSDTAAPASGGGSSPVTGQLPVYTAPSDTAIAITAGVGTIGDGGSFAIKSGASAATASGAGGDLNLNAGVSNGSLNGGGGAVNIVSGAGSGSGTANGGAISLNAGIGGGTDGVGGSVLCVAGNTNSATGSGGSVNFTAGLGGINGVGGNVSLSGGDSGVGAAFNYGGTINITSGTSRASSGQGGAINFFSGIGTCFGQGGDISLLGGQGGATGSGSSIILTAGNRGPNGGIAGNVQISAGSGPNPSLNGEIQLGFVNSGKVRIGTSASLVLSNASSSGDPGSLWYDKSNQVLKFRDNANNQNVLCSTSGIPGTVALWASSSKLYGSSSVTWNGSSLQVVNNTVTGGATFTAIADGVRQAIVFGQYIEDVTATSFRSDKARGTLASPGAVQSGDDLGFFAARGYTNASAFGDQFGISMTATQNWTSANNGAKMTFQSIPNNTNGRVAQWIIDQDGSFKGQVAGNGFFIKEGSNATMGVATLSGTATTVNTNKVTASSRIFLTGQNANGGVPAFMYVSGRSAGTSFTIANAGTDTSIVAWLLIEPS